MCRLGFFRSRRAPSPSPSPKWLQLSGPQIGTAGTALARCPPPSRVCLRERKPAHLWNPSLSPRSPLPPVPWERGVSRPHSGALFPLPRSDYNAGSVPSRSPSSRKAPSVVGGGPAACPRPPAAAGPPQGTHTRSPGRQPRGRRPGPSGPPLVPKAKASRGALWGLAEWSPPAVPWGWGCRELGLEAPLPNLPCQTAPAVHDPQRSAVTQARC